ncbi:MAG TPA: hypothetical protein VEL82_08775 [Thermoplasmata archaeon]|nr:hypothetical protein [Thermoplasmata archaeon]
MPAARAQVYEYRTVFRAPPAFVFRWCTDYRSDDHRLSGDGGERRILQRSARRVVYEDLESTRDGWSWSRWTVTLHPPRSWHGRATGNYRNWEIDYRLKALPDGRTAFHLRGVREPRVLGSKNPSQASMRADLGQQWSRYRRSLEADYRRSQRGRGGPRSRRR